MSYRREEMERAWIRKGRLKVEVEVGTGRFVKCMETVAGMCQAHCRIHLLQRKVELRSNCT